MPVLALPVEVAVRSHTDPVGSARTDMINPLARNTSWHEATGRLAYVRLAVAVDAARDGDLSRLVVATGPARGVTLGLDYKVLQPVPQTLAVGGSG